MSQQEEQEYQPYDLEIEQALLGYCLTEPKLIAILQACLKPSDFYDPLHQRLFERVFAKFEAERPVTPLTLNSAMKTDIGYQQVGGHGYLVDVMQAAPALPKEADKFVSDLARTVVDFRVRREALDALQDADQLIVGGKPVLNALAPILDVADSETERTDTNGGSTPISDSAYSLMQEVETASADDLPAAPTGIARLDLLIGGYFQANLTVVGGRPGMGKSVFGATAARAAAQDGWAVDYFDLENTNRTLTSRMLCDLDYDEAIRRGKKGIEFSKVHLRRLTDEEKGRLAEAAALQARNLDITVHDRDELTMRQIAAMCRAKAARCSKPMLVIIDHMHLIEPSDRYMGRKVDEIAEITRGAKRLAKRLSCSVMLLAQLNRDVEKREDKRPTMADFRESGSIEQDADIMIGLHRPRYYLEKAKPREGCPSDELARWQNEMERTKTLLEVCVLKNRHGTTQQIDTFCDIGCAVIRDQEPREGYVPDAYHGEQTDLVF